MTDIDEKAPFPLPPSRETQALWIEAVLATKGVNVPRAALENAAPFIVDPEEALGEPDPDGVRRVKAGAVRRIRTDAGDMVVLVVRMHGVGGVQWSHNERISSIWRSVADPTVGRGTEKTLASVLPWSRVDAQGCEHFMAALRSGAKNRQALLMDAEDAADALLKRDKVRPYDLEEDLVLNGQQEPGMYVPQEVRLEEGPEPDDGGGPVPPEAFWGWMAVRGNNRTQKRQSIFGLTSGEVLAGVPAEKLGRPEGGIVWDPQDWLTAFSTLLNREYAESGDDLDPKNAPRARRAAAVAVVDAHLVVGTPTPQRLYRIVQMSNRRDHVHPPLEFDPVDRSRALGRAVLGMYVARGVMDEKTAEVLSGLAPVRELPGATHEMTVTELRDLRSMALLQELFPVDPLKRHLLRRALSEGPPSQLKTDEINQRARAWSALTSLSYPRPWNPRIGQIFTSKVREGIVLSGRPLPELLAAADSDDQAFEELVSYRAAHWLASFGIVEADRGSLDGQEAIGESGELVRRTRRGVPNVLQALRHEKKRRAAVGVLQSLAEAMEEGDRQPWQVSGSGGMRMAGRPMTPLWLDVTFPKETGTRPRKAASVSPRVGASPSPVAPPGQPELGAEPTAPGSPGSAVPRPAPVPPSASTSPSAPVSLPAPAAVPAARDSAAAHVPAGPVEEGRTVPDLLLRVEGRIREVNAGAVEVRGLLTELKERAGDPSAPAPIGRGRADAAVRLLNQTVALLRELPELVEVMAQDG
ncbi:hypothetical protein EF912_04960 [Streptomyces sp. WAC07061]|uniref:hypothetical protein n=1 Tax=Streptomyces sp. WAC07061 TaxID=2487410 RepID=UPI000F789C73|nr:hypothetical protein [Streptomyces sp. WAC07061]RSS62706.1 hypothetical protein EF912_04960 [Streptomyces sp. WAC07061]